MASDPAKSAAKIRQKSKKPRLNSEERRHQILEKAAQLVTKNGPDQVTTRLIAQEAKISEALLYQHFSSKDEMLMEITDILKARSPSIHDYFAHAEPSSRILVEYLYLTTYLTLHPGLQKKEADLPRLLLESLLSDGDFLRTHVKRRWRLMEDILKQSLEGAKAAGHLVSKDDPPPGQETLGVMLSHQALIMMHCFQYLPERPILETGLSPDALIDQVMGFILRGLGYKESVIKKLYQPEKIIAQFRKVCGTKEPSDTKTID